ncbi:DUF6883 domain-containing protein [Sulfuricystis thermophila]|uniref:DUF6883 domain-containing protein n=1 Tax=Sulfuricystis thermophila TaxID=2496847 RepID=UPI0010358073|nr:DUF6883 domain-containing protein [Sulfuricystis thermophila]
MRLPNLERLHIDIAKLTEYVLNPAHPEGRHKARVFLSALGISVANARWLADEILRAVKDAEAVAQSETKWGTIYRVDIEITRGLRCAKVRTAWLCTVTETRLVTCFVIGECNEAA